jgi:glutaredoxin 3
MSAAPVVIYTKSWCPYCIRAKALLDAKQAGYQEIDIEREPQRRAEMVTRSGRSTVPQIFIGDTHVGGCDDLHELEARGGLDPLLAR